jgi:uncharacterized cupin superfamily protein
MAGTQAFTRVICNGEGGSTFSDSELSLSPQIIADGVPPMLIGTVPTSSDAMYLRSTMFDSTPHPAPRKQWVIMLRGAIEVAVTDGSSREFRAGDLLLLEDTEGTGHTTKAVGDPPFEALFLPAS